MKERNGLYGTSGKISKPSKTNVFSGMYGTRCKWGVGYFYSQK